MDEGDLLGDRIVSFVINDREDNEESRERSELNIEIRTESDTLEYIYYYVLDCRYSDDRGWRIKDYELDENRESVYNAITSVTEEDVENAFYTRILSMAVDGPDVIFEEGEFTDITICNEDFIPADIDKISYRYPVETMTVSFTWENDHNSYSRDMTMEWKFYDDVWKIDTYEYISNITTELTSETSEELSDERMLDDLYRRSIERMWGEIYLTPDMCESYTFGDYEFFHDGSCQRELEMELKGDDIFTVHVSAIFAYDYDEEFGWEQKGNILVRIKGVEQNLVGNYSGTVYNEDGEQYATVYYYILEADDDGNFSGYIKWVPDGEDVDSVEEIGLTGTYNIDLLSLVVEYDEEIDILGYNKISEESIYYNFETQHLFFL